MSTNEQTVSEGALPRALRVMEFLARAGEPVRLSAVAEALGLQKSTVHRILSSLVSCGYIEQVQKTSCYAVTLKLWELGTGAIHEHPIRRVAAGFLQELHRSTGETVSLTILSGDDVLYLDKILSPRAIKFTTRVGSRAPAAFTAGGKAMLAHLPDASARLKRTAARVKRTQRFEVDAVLRELESVRTQGYSISTHVAGVTGFGAALMARDGLPVAALSISAPNDRLSASQRRQLIARLLNACASMSERVRL